LLTYIQERLGGDYLKIFITGESGVGKTTLIEEISEILEKNGVKISGFITKEERVQGKRVGFKIIDLIDKKEYLFASKIFESGIKFGSYHLHIKNLEEVLRKSINYKYEYLIIDEIGKMEFYSNYFKEVVNNLVKSDKNIVAVLHRDFIENFNKYGKIYVLYRYNKEEIKNEILKTILRGEKNG